MRFVLTDIIKILWILVLLFCACPTVIFSIVIYFTSIRKEVYPNWWMLSRMREHGVGNRRTWRIPPTMYDWPLPYHIVRKCFRWKCWQVNDIPLRHKNHSFYLLQVITSNSYYLPILAQKMVTRKWAKQWLNISYVPKDSNSLCSDQSWEILAVCLITRHGSLSMNMTGGQSKQRVWSESFLISTYSKTLSPRCTRIMSHNFSSTHHFKMWLLRATVRWILILTVIRLYLLMCNG